MSGKLVALCGIDGAGKTSLWKSLQDYHQFNQNIAFYRAFDDPMLTSELEEVAHKMGMNRRECFSKKLRAVMWYNDLAINIAKNIVPALKKNQIVIVDRYITCNKVYFQYSASEMFFYYQDKYSLLREADYIFYLDVECACDRISKRDKKAPYESYEGLNTLKKMYEKVLEETNSHVIRVNANMHEKLVFQEVLGEIEKYM